MLINLFIRMQMRNLGFEGRTCLDSPARKKDLRKAVSLYPCHNQGGNQVEKLFSLYSSLERHRLCVCVYGSPNTFSHRWICSAPFAYNGHIRFPLSRFYLHYISLYIRYLFWFSSFSFDRICGFSFYFSIISFLFLCFFLPLSLADC